MVQSPFFTPRTLDGETTPNAHGEAHEIYSLDNYKLIPMLQFDVTGAQGFNIILKYVSHIRK